MPEPKTADQQVASNEGGEGSGFTPPATQDELNQIINDRLKRERAKYADYKDLQGKAAKFDELEKANQTELEKATNRAAEAETERDQARAETLRYRVAAAHGISTAPAADGGKSDADLFLTGTDEETLKSQAERLTQRSEDRKKQGNHVPSEGTNHQPQSDDMRSFVSELFTSGE